MRSQEKTVTKQKWSSKPWWCFSFAIQLRKSNTLYAFVFKAAPIRILQGEMGQGASSSVGESGAYPPPPPVSSDSVDATSPCPAEYEPYRSEYYEEYAHLLLFGVFFFFFFGYSAFDSSRCL
jgi:hypothetical protein